MLLIGILTGLIILILLVVVHELGHGIVARRNGVKVEEFGIGFPPKAWARTIKQSVLGKDVLFSLNWLPLGGFVRLKGEHDEANEAGTYGAASYWVKTKILLAGVLMNWIVAGVLLSFIALAGMPKILPNQFMIASDATVVKKPLEIAGVEDNTPARQAGLETGDQLLRVNGAVIQSSEELTTITQQQKGKEIEIIYVRDGVEYVKSLTLREDNKDQRGYLGVATAQREEIKSTWSAPLVGVGTAAQFTWVTLEGVGQLLVNTFTGFISSLSPNESTREAGSKELSTVSESVAGPVGILGVIFPRAQEAGLKELTFLTAIISLSLAVMNSLPIPALDGGRWFVMTIYRLLKKPLTKAREEKIQTVGFLVLMGLVVLVTFADVAKLF